MDKVILNIMGRLLELETWDQDDVSKLSKPLNLLENKKGAHKKFVDVVEDNISKIIMVNGKIYTLEKETPSPFPWNEKNKRDFKIDTVNQFKIDWRKSTGTDFNDKYPRYILLRDRIKEICNKGIEHPLSNMSKNRVREYDLALFSPTVEKIEDDDPDSRVYFGIFPQNNIIYLLSFVSWNDKLLPDTDYTEAVKRADTILGYLSKTLKENPL
jgi:hypothetical protein